MRLTDLSPQWIRNLEEGRRRFVVEVDSRVEANGIRFRCPACDTRGAGAVHALLLWDTGVGAAVTPGPERWAIDGSSFEDLTLDHPVQLHRDCRAHFRIFAGEVFKCS